MLDFKKQIANLEARLLTNNDINTAATLTLRYWQASCFSNSKTEAHTLMQHANHVALTAHRRNISHVEMYTLAIFISIEAGHYDSAAEMLDKAMSHKSFLRTHAPYEYAVIHFLYAYLETKRQHSRSAKKYWRMLEKHAQNANPGYSIMLGLLHLAGCEYDSAFSYLREAYLGGSTSIFLYEGLYRYYCTAPHSPKDEIILPLLVYTVGRGVNVNKLAARHHHALLAAVSSNSKMGELLYDISGYAPLLQPICANRIANADTSPKAYTYYQEAESKQVPVEGLSAYLVYEAHVSGADYINRNILAQFLHNSEMEMEAELAVYVYHLILTNPELGELLTGREAYILQLAEGMILSEADDSGVARSREANSLYHYFWLKNRQQRQDDESLEKIEEVLMHNLTLYEVTANTAKNSPISHIYITEPEKRGTTVYSMQNAIGARLTIEATGQAISYACLGSGQRTVLDEKLTIRRMIPIAGAELYLHFFNKGDRRFYLLTYLTNHYLKNPYNAAIPVFEAVLAEESLAKVYRFRILMALGGLYYNESNFDKALECYNQVDEDALNNACVTHILMVYMQKGEIDCAVAFLQKKYPIISMETLQEVVCTLLSHPIDHALLSEAAYKLVCGGFYTQQLLSLVLSHYNASYCEWTALARKLGTANITSQPLDIKILETAIWMASWDTDVQNAFVRVYNRRTQFTPTENIIDEFVEYATYELLANATQPEYDTLYVLEELCVNNTLLKWGLASCYLHHNITTQKSEEILNQAITSLESEGILFPVFKQNRFLRTLFIEKHQPFLHRGLPGKNYQLYYRIDNAKDFTPMPMRYVKFGLYVACLPLFYNEEVTYYVCEELATGSIATKEETIKNTTPFLCEQPLDEFFAINNAIIYEQMFKHDQVEDAISSLVKDVVVVRSQLL